MHLSKFIKQKSYEDIKYVLHRHPITFVPTIFLFLVLALVPFILWLVFEKFFTAFFQSGNDLSLVIVLLLSFYYIGLSVFFFIEFILYYLDVWVITNDRVIDVDQISLFSRTISELDLASVQDVTTDVKGFFPTLLNYGNVTIKTASDNAHIVFFEIPNPNKIRSELIDLSDKDKERHVMLRDNLTKVDGLSHKEE